MLCEDFQSALSHSKTPDMDRYLKLLPSELRSDLFRQLLKIELKHLQRLGVDIDLGELLDRYPEFQEEARSEFKQVVSGNEPGTQYTEEAATIPPNATGITDETVTVPPSSDRRFSQVKSDTTVGAATSRENNGLLTKVFGDYEILEEIARGGMGVVYKARQTKLNRVVALKMILAGHLAGEEDIERFRSEATAAANLEHFGIVPIFEIGEIDGQHYFSMGFVDGESLADRVADGPLGMREAADLTKRIAEAVAYAHEKGVVHRDLKPANVLIDSVGEPKVTDFGLAKQQESDSNLTRTGAVMGTPSYMPPEQASGQAVGPLADVYSLGAILYCLLTARPPFQAATPLDTLMQVLDQEPVPPKRLNALVDRDLDTICLKCLEKKQAQRYQSAQELADDLQRFLDGEPIHARPANAVERSIKWVRRRPLISSLMALVLVLAIVGFTGILWNWREAVYQFGRAEDSLQKAKEALSFAEERRIAAEKAEVEQSRLRQKAEAARETAEVAEQREIEARKKESTARKRAERDRDAKQVALQKAKGLALTAQSTAIRKTHPALSLLLAIESAKSNPSRVTIANLYQARDASREVKTIRGNSVITAIAASEDGSVIATSGLDGMIAIWDGITGKQKWRSPYFGLQLASIALSSDGDKVAATITGDLPSNLIGKQLPNRVEQLLQGFLKKKEKSAPKETHLTDRVVRVWGVSKRRELFRLIGHEDRVTDVKFAKNGKLVFTCSWDRTVRMWDGETGKELKKWTDIDGRPVRAIDVSKNGDVLIAVPEFKPFKSIYRTESVKDPSRVDPDEPLPRITGNIGNINISSITIPKINRETAIFYIIDTNKEKSVHYLRNGEVTATCCGLSSDGRVLAIGCTEGAGFVYQNGQWEKPIATLSGHKGEIRSVELNTCGDQVVTGGWDRTVRVWDVGDPEKAILLKGHTSICNDVMFGPNDEFVFSAGEFTTRLWDLRAIPPLAKYLPQQSKKVLSVQFGSNGKDLVSASLDGAVSVWDVQTGVAKAVLTENEKKNSAQWAYVYSDQNRVLANAFQYNSLRVWWKDYPDEPLKFGGDRGSAAAAMSPDGKRVVSVSDSQKRTLINNGKGTHQYSNFSDNVGFVRIWETQTGKQIAELPQRTHPAYQPQISSDSQWMLIPLHDEGSENLKTLHMISLEDGKSIRSFPPSKSPFLSVAIHPNNQIGVVGSRGNVLMLDLTNGKIIKELIGFRVDVTDCRFSPDGGRFATVSDTTVYVWDTNSLELISTLEGHEKMITKTRFTPDGKKLFTLSLDGTAAIWNIQTSKIETLFQASYADKVIDADLSPDGELVVTGSEDGNIRIWPVDVWPLVEARVPRNLTASEKKQYDLKSWTEEWGDSFAKPPRQKTVQSEKE